MKRISSQLPSHDSSYYLRLREWELNRMNNNVASGSRIKDLRDDPLAAARSVRLQSAIFRSDQYASNVDTLRESLSSSEGQLRSAMDVLQRIRELAVQGANGVYDASQLGYMGEEVDQLLGELVTIGNARDETGNYLFAGTAVRTEPFRLTHGRVPGGAADLVTGVEYLGNDGENPVEVTEGTAVSAVMPGNRAFWAEQQQIYATVDATQYRVPSDAAIRVDGVDIPLATGDPVGAIVAKINDSGAPVRASLDPVTGGMVLQSTQPHQIALADLGGATVLQDLGVLAPGGSRPPLNTSPSARVFGGSIFDVVIHLRDAMLEGSSEKVGSSGLGGIENAITTLAGTVAGLGAKDSRLETVASRLSWERPELVRFDSRERDLDLSEALTSLKALEYGHEAALNVAARVLTPSLLDFLR
jgi:flagellar hook-associated protein 3 FlgL